MQTKAKFKRVTRATVCLLAFAGLGFSDPPGDTGDWEAIYRYAGLGPSNNLNVLTDPEQSLGWELLFDGEFIPDLWRGFQQDSLPPSWIVDDKAMLRHHSGGGTIIYDKPYDNFIWALEWKIEPLGNSGIFIRGDESQTTLFWSAIEMQVLDNVNSTVAGVPEHMAGGAYDLYPPTLDEDTRFDATFSAEGNPDGYNKVLIIASGPRVEFWLNGYRLVQFDIGSEDWNRRFEMSKFRRYSEFGILPSGFIGLQDHTNKVWYRNLKIRPLPQNATEADIWPGLESVGIGQSNYGKNPTVNRLENLRVLRLDGKWVGNKFYGPIPVLGD